MTERIDAHHHLWQLGQFDYSWLDKPALARIRKSYLPADLAPQLQQAGIQRTVLVQTQHNLAENRWALGLADQHPFIAGVVGWVDLASPRCEADLEEFVEHPKFVGIRHVVQDEPDDDFILRPQILQGLGVLERRQVPYDLLFYVKHLKHAATVADRFPQLPLVIDHLAKPEIREQHIDNWLPQLKEAAKRPNVCCKLSGLATEADWAHWRPADLRPYVDAALECFGPSRLMYGSDWPVCELAGSYAQIHAALAELIARLSPAEQAEIMGGTARRFYGLADA
jgi:L-fuconolactonase